MPWHACCRILEYLLQLPDADVRRELLSAAFESAPEPSEQGYDASSEGVDSENEQLSTTPLQLLQVLDACIAGTGIQCMQ